jgi:hypothetical protein
MLQVDYRQLHMSQSNGQLMRLQLLLEPQPTLLKKGPGRVGNYVGGGVVGGIGPVRSIAGAAGDIAAGNVFKDTPYETPARVVGGILGASVPTGAASLISPQALSPREAGSR